MPERRCIGGSPDGGTPLFIGSIGALVFRRMIGFSIEQYGIEKDSI